MPAQPDKYPAPPGENVFAWILRAADGMRRQQIFEADLARSRLAAERRESLARLKKAEEWAEHGRSAPARQESPDPPTLPATEAPPRNHR